MSCKILLVGVGGQGVLSAARWLGEAAMAAGHDVRVGQLHGMSQRGGSVEASVIIGEGHSPFIVGPADVVIALEPLELARARARIGPRTVALCSTGKLVPLPLAMAGEDYPDVDSLLSGVRRDAARVIDVDGPALVGQVGSARALNVLMLGALDALGVLPFDGDTLLAAIGPGEWNDKAFSIGREAVR